MQTRPSVIYFRRRCCRRRNFRCVTVYLLCLVFFLLCECNFVWSLFLSLLGLVVIRIFLWNRLF